MNDHATRLPGGFFGRGSARRERPLEVSRFGQFLTVSDSLNTLNVPARLPDACPEHIGFDTATEATPSDVRLLRALWVTSRNFPDRISSTL